jgi:glycosyltransferase involved in cell wall biosynthesis
VGRLETQKGIFRGIDELSKIDSRFRFKVVGKGRHKDGIKSLCKELNIDVRFLGFVSDDQLIREYAEADLLLLPSYYEGFPIVGLEAAGSGLPIISFDDSRVGEMVCTENAKLLGRREGDLARAIEILLSNNNLYNRISAKNQRRVKEKFTAESMCSKYLEKYRELKK